jgi:hypothetical protein
VLERQGKVLSYLPFQHGCPMNGNMTVFAAESPMKPTHCVDAQRDCRITGRITRAARSSFGGPSARSIWRLARHPADRCAPRNGLGGRWRPPGGTQRQKLRRQPGNDGKTLVLVAPAALGQAQPRGEGGVADRHRRRPQPTSASDRAAGRLIGVLWCRRFRTPTRRRISFDDEPGRRFTR